MKKKNWKKPMKLKEPLLTGHQEKFPTFQCIRAREKRGKMFVAAFRLTYCALLCCRAWKKAGKMFQVSQALFNIFHVKVMVHKCFALTYFSVSEGYILLFSLLTSFLGSVTLLKDAAVQCATGLSLDALMIYILRIKFRKSVS